MNTEKGPEMTTVEDSAFKECTTETGRKKTRTDLTAMGGCVNETNGCWQ